MRSKLRETGVAAWAIVAALSSLPLESNAAYNVASPYKAPSNLGFAQVQRDGLRYFGYPMLASYKPASQGPAVPDFSLIPEMKNHTNIVGAVYDHDNPTGLYPLLDQLGPGFRAVIFVEGIFLKPDGSYYSDAEITQRLERFKAYYASRSAYIVYFGFDEPLWRMHGYFCRTTPQTCPGGPDGSTPSTSVNSIGVPLFEYWISRMRTAVPGPSIFHVEAGPMIHENQWLPVNADLYAFDHYVPWGVVSNGKTLQQRWDLLKAKVNELNSALSGHRRLAIVPETEALYKRGTTPASPAILTSREQADNAALALYMNYYDRMYKPNGVANPMVNMIAPWIWADLDGGEGTITAGARGLPLTRDRLQRDGHAVRVSMGQASGSFQLNWWAPPLIQFTFTNNTMPGQNGVWAWSATGATSCYSVSEPGAFPSSKTSGAIINYEPVARELDYTIGCTGPYGTSQKTIRIKVANP